MARRDWLILAGLVLVVAAAHAWRNVPTEPFFNNDETRHVMTGVFFRDLYRDGAVGHPRDYAVSYFLQYPALGLLIWPPFFYAVEGAVMLAFGTSILVARLLVGAFAAMACVYLYRLARRTHGAPTAAVAVLLFGFAPLVFDYSRQVMLEVPTLALSLAAMFYFVRYLDEDRRRDVYAAAVASALAALTRFDAVFLLPFFGLLVIGRGRWDVRHRRDPWGAAGLALLLVAPVYAVTAAEIGWGHLKTIRAGNEVASGFFDPAALAYYPACLPRQVGWFVLAPGCVGLALALTRPAWRSSGPYLALTAAAYLTFSFLGIPESRHTIYWVPAFTVFAAAGVEAVGRRAGGRCACAALAAVAVAGTAWTACRGPAPFVRGYEAAARYVVEHTHDSPFCLIDTYLEGNVIYHVRRHDPDRRLWVLRGDKLFYGVLGEPKWGYDEYVQSDADILAVLDRYGPELLLVEEPRVNYTLPMAERLRRLVHARPERFALEAEFSIETNQRLYRGTRLLVYRDRQRTPHPDRHLEVDMQWLRRRLGTSVSGEARR